ncbi:hypothetical protein [Bradyrhizobium elkanii]|uniref:hypothetical protein n=1 Tax=Bradyrhizobium elkanii TaxID=29448 RepID=UPI00272D51C6|nr:hypothetical protein [Bradyrhizobium elkanii]WLA81946.1 hypothetical protein QNJ99_42445 [Bradyrhizobium elkanii]
MTSRKKIKLSETMSEAERADLAFTHALSVAEAAATRADKARAKADRARAHAAHAEAEAELAGDESIQAKREAIRKGEALKKLIRGENGRTDASAQDPASDDQDRSIHTDSRELLIKALGMLGSDQVGERAAAALMAEKQRIKLGMTWNELIVNEQYDKNLDEEDLDSEDDDLDDDEDHGNLDDDDLDDEE